MKTIGLVVAGVLIGLLAAGLIWLAASPPRGEAVTLQPLPSTVPIVVQVEGEVLRPGVYSLSPGSRVQDAIQAASGFTLKADRSGINLAALLVDGQQMTIPALSAERTIGQAPAGTPGVGTTPLPGELININTADLAALDTLPGIGPAIAQRIIDYRTSNGPFDVIESIMNVSGITQATFDDIKDLITVGD